MSDKRSGNLKKALTIGERTASTGKKRFNTKSHPLKKKLPKRENPPQVPLGEKASFGYRKTGKAGKKERGKPPCQEGWGPFSLHYCRKESDKPTRRKKRGGGRGVPLRGGNTSKREGGACRVPRKKEDV